jgi:hypothetical protein
MRGRLVLPRPASIIFYIVGPASRRALFSAKKVDYHAALSMEEVLARPAAAGRRLRRCKPGGSPEHAPAVEITAMGMTINQKMEQTMTMKLVNGGK